MQAILPALSRQYNTIQIGDSLAFFAAAILFDFYRLNPIIFASDYSIYACPRGRPVTLDKDPELIGNAAQYLRAFSVGYYFVCIGAIPYILLFTIGRIRTHLYFTAGYITFYIPILHEVIT